MQKIGCGGQAKISLDNAQFGIKKQNKELKAISFRCCAESTVWNCPTNLQNED